MNKKLDGFVARVGGVVRSYWFAMAVFLVVGAFALTFFLELRYFGDDFSRTWQFFAERPLVFWYNAYLVLLCLLFLTGLTRRPAIALGMVLCLFILVGYVSAAKFGLRGAPLLPEDLLLAGEAGSLSRMVNGGGVAVTATAMVVWMGGAVLLNVGIGRIFELKERRQVGEWWQRFAVVPRLVLVVTAMLLMVLGTDFVRNNSGQQHEAVPWLDSELVAWSQTENYDRNGFILGFLYNLQKFDLAPPEGYSKAAVLEVRERYEKLAEEGNALRGELDANLVVVLGESFMDPDEMDRWYPHAGGDIVPELHAAMAKYPSGQMYSTEYGGGTANIEFEVLSGLSNYWAYTVPYTALVPKMGKVPSVASYLLGEGFATTGVHTFNGAMYKRDFAYMAFDIERFITEREIRHVERDGGSPYLNDRSAYLEVEEVLEEDTGKDFVLAVTMQNHSPYLDWVLGEGEVSPYQMSGELPLEGARREELAVYYRLLHAADGHLGEFLDDLSNSAERTAVLFFGDHLPGLFPEIQWNADFEIRDVAQWTPYFVYTNFGGLGEGGVGRVDLPTTTPNCLVNTTFNLLGARKPALYYLLDEVCTEVPILARGFLGEEGYEESEVMRDYELVTYDLLGGGGYWRR